MSKVKTESFVRQVIVFKMSTQPFLYINAEEYIPSKSSRYVESRLFVLHCMHSDLHNGAHLERVEGRISFQVS